MRRIPVPRRQRRGIRRFSLFLSLAGQTKKLSTIVEDVSVLFFRRIHFIIGSIRFEEEEEEEKKKEVREEKSNDRNRGRGDTV